MSETGNIRDGLQGDGGDGQWRFKRMQTELRKETPKKNKKSNKLKQQTLKLTERNCSL